MMSQTDSSCATSSKEKKPSVCDSVKNKISAKDSAENGAKCVNDNSSSSDKTQKERVLKEVGFTSTSFIGPAFPPETATVTVNTDIEDTLSEFYKELEEIDTPDDTNFNTEKQDAGVVRPSLQSKTPTSKEIHHTKQENTDNTSRPAETDAYQRRSGQKHASWPHWYQNEPYHHKRQRSGIDMHSGMATPPHSQQHYPLNRPPNPRFDRPPFHPPLPPSAFPNQQDPPLHTNHNWSSSGMTNQYRDQPPFPPFSTYKSGPPLPQDFLGDNSHHHDRAEKGYYDHDAHPDHFNAGRHRDKQEVLSQFGEDFDWRQRFHSKNELSERDPHCRPPDNSRSQDSVLVLILMRGLPGSGKSTMARELLSTGPSGLILSTDDYFAYKGGYRYEPGLLRVAHEWNQSRAKDAMCDGRSPVIIDNTNIQAWEMKPYVKMALERGYRVDFCEPNTRWKFDPHELEKRNKHGVPQEKIAHMMDRFSFPISIDIVMNSQEPPHVNQRCRREQPQMRKNRDFY